MDTGSITLDYRAHRIPFDRVDAQDYSHIVGMDTLIDLPNILQLVRFRFTNGIGFECINSTACDQEDWDDAITALQGAQLIRVRPMAPNGMGHPQWLSQYWAHDHL